METWEMEAEVYAALKANMPEYVKAVYHMEAPSEEYPRAPCLVYSAVSDVAILHGDNKETLHRVIIRIHIITEDGNYGEIYSAVKRVMAERGFTRRQTTEIAGRGRKIMTADFKKTIGG